MLGGYTGVVRIGTILGQLMSTPVKDTAPADGAGGSHESKPQRRLRQPANFMSGCSFFSIRSRASSLIQ